MLKPARAEIRGGDFWWELPARALAADADVGVLRLLRSG